MLPLELAEIVFGYMSFNNIVYGPFGEAGRAM